MKWKRIAPGWYQSGKFEITRDFNDHGEEVWYCRYEGILFDQGDTLWEAKQYCKED